MDYFPILNDSTFVLFNLKSAAACCAYRRDTNAGLIIYPTRKTIETFENLDTQHDLTKMVSFYEIIGASYHFNAFERDHMYWLYTFGLVEHYEFSENKFAWRLSLIGKSALKSLQLGYVWSVDKGILWDETRRFYRAILMNDCRGFRLFLDIQHIAGKAKSYGVFQHFDFKFRDVEQLSKRYYARNLKWYDELARKVILRKLVGEEDE